MLDERMTNITSFLRIFLFLFLGIVATLDAAQKQPTIWFHPRSSIPVFHYIGVDYMDLFKPDAPWQNGVGHVKVFKFYWQFFKTSIEEGGASDADIKATLEFLKQRNIAMAIEAGLVADKNQGKVEGYDGTVMEPIVARIKRLGGDLRYVAMDEPFWFGHLVTRKQDPYAQEASIPDLARNVARQVAMIHRYFPDAQVGDIEPVVNPGRKDYDSHYPEKVIEWNNAYKEAAGQPLAFFMADFAWNSDGKAPESYAELSRLLKQNGIPVGIIFDASAGMTTGEEWTTNTEKHFVNVESSPSLIPDIALIQSWDSQPDHALPETKRGTMTYLLNRYLAAQTELKVNKTRDGFDGTLSSSGVAVPGAFVTAEECDDGNQNILWTATQSGKVPVEAVKAQIGLRVNVETEGSDKTVDIQMGEARYTDEKSKFTYVHQLVPPGSRLQVPSSQKVTTGSKLFEVTAGDFYSLSVPMQVPWSSRHSGYVAIFFFNKEGKEITRVPVWFEPGKRIFWSGKTASSGCFTIRMTDPKKLPSIVRFDFAGDASHRLSFVSLP